jgi:hypothetical protein
MNLYTPSKAEGHHDLESFDGDKNPFDRIENNSLFELEFDMESKIEQNETKRNS